MRTMLSFLIVVLLVLSVAPTAMAQECTTDFECLMAGQTVELDWGDGVVWGTEHDEIPPAAELLREFVDYFWGEGGRSLTSDYVWVQIVQYASPSMTNGNGDESFGLNALTATWNAESATLSLQSSRYVPATTSNGGDGENLNTCGGGVEGFLWTEVNKCLSPDERIDGAEFMPTTTTVSVYYRVVFIVEYLPPVDWLIQVGE